MTRTYAGSMWLGMQYFSLQGPASTSVALPGGAGTWYRNTQVHKLAGN